MSNERRYLIGTTQYHDVCYVDGGRDPTTKECHHFSGVECPLKKMMSALNHQSNRKGTYTEEEIRAACEELPVSVDNARTVKPEKAYRRRWSYEEKGDIYIHCQMPLEQFIPQVIEVVEEGRIRTNGMYEKTGYIVMERKS